MAQPNINNSSSKEDLKTISNCIFDIFFNWRRGLKEEDYTEKEGIAQCILQMFYSKLQSLLSLSEGIPIPIDRENEKIKISDPISMIAIWRTIYEMTFIFHNIYIMPDSEEEHKILLYLWQIRGLNNRQKHNTIIQLPERYKEKYQKEKKDIEKLRVIVNSIIDGLNITEQARMQIGNALNKDSSMLSGFNFKKENGIITTFERISFEDSPKYLFAEPNMSILYSFLSMHSHPSYLTVLQFGQLYNGHEDIRFLNTILKGACKLSSTFISDFCSCIKNASIYYEKLDNQNKDIFKYYKSI